MSIVQGAAAASPSLLEVTHHGQKHLGKLEAKSANMCWLMERDGRLAQFEISQIDSIRTAAPRFREYSLAELRDQLRRVMPKQFRIDGTGHFLICAEKNSRRIGEICEDTYRTFHRYFTVRGFKISPPQFPLVIIVFPDRASFVAYCRKDGIEPPSGLLGYYMRLTNRVALFEGGRSLNAQLEPSAADRDRSVWRANGARSPLTQWWKAICTTRSFTRRRTRSLSTRGSTRGSDRRRNGWSKGWRPCSRPPASAIRRKRLPKLRINRGRYLWFGNYMQTRRRPHSLDDFVSSDDLYSSATLDAYSEGWALTFFLAETRHASYGRYLKTIAQRNPLKAYTAADRLADFHRAFGDTKTLETDFLRFFEKLK